MVLIHARIPAPGLPGVSGVGEQLCINPGQMTTSSPGLCDFCPSSGVWSSWLSHFCLFCVHVTSPLLFGLVEVVMEVEAGNFLTLGPVVCGGPSSNLEVAVTMCLPQPDSSPGRVLHTAKCEKP